MLILCVIFRIGVICFNIGVIIFVSHCYINACVVIFNSYYSLFTNLFYLLNLQKIAKKRKSVTSAIRCFVSYFGMNVVMFRVNISSYVHACVKLYGNMCVMF